ncbi:uncharacterized protein LOC119769347 [Culex quinquefasciatus]|uniref:uncharacterized protein LOC119769347 n=1 Tax=Culex quinquefasciatus TaxID=7176 RepID=UPI0018E30F98|nr:uncharacterized protein LOC119769347 [Culex quinquefasciatus]
MRKNVAVRRPRVNVGSARRRSGLEAQSAAKNVSTPIASAVGLRERTGAVGSLIVAVGPDLGESTRRSRTPASSCWYQISRAIYDMLGACSSNKPADSAEERAKNIFAKMDENNDGQLTQDEFLKGCLQDEELSKMLAP